MATPSWDWAYGSILANPDKFQGWMQRLDEWALKKKLVRGELDIDDSMGNGHAILADKATGDWVLYSGGSWVSSVWPNDEQAYERSDNPFESLVHGGAVRWDARLWLARRRDWNRHAAHRLVYGSTIQAVKAGAYESEQGNIVQIPPDPGIVSGSKFYSHELTPEPAQHRYDTEITVESNDCLVTAERLVRNGDGKVAVLNMANAYTPGGGALYGSAAQEESCFFRSNYYLSLYRYADFGTQFQLELADERYPLNPNYGGCYSPNITVFRGPKDDGYPYLDDPWKVNFIAVAAIDTPPTTINDEGERRLGESSVTATKNKIRTILNIAIDNDVDELVLSAFGCGAFHNPPKHMAELFRDVLNEDAYRGRFKRIVFAIIGHGNNYQSFAEVFGAGDEAETASEAVSPAVSDTATAAVANAASDTVHDAASAAVRNAASNTASDTVSATVPDASPAPSADPWKLQRFVDAQQLDYDRALSEVRAGAKRSHWMWYIFPQVQGLGSSSTSRYYGITGLDEAKAYLAHPVLGPRLIKITQAALKLDNSSATAVFGQPDDMKLRSCMTLFALADPEQPVFNAVLEKWFSGKPDRRTISIVNR